MRLPIPGLTIESQPDDILCGMLAWGEARGESEQGKAAVIWVAKNRALKNGRGIHREILKPWQFSAFNEGDPNRAKMLEPTKHDAPEVWDECYRIAVGVLNGAIDDPTNGATHYCTTAIWGEQTKPGFGVQWYHAIEIESGRTVETARIGHHVFARAS